MSNTNVNTAPIVPATGLERAISTSTRSAPKGVRVERTHPYIRPSGWRVTGDGYHSVATYSYRGAMTHVIRRARALAEGAGLIPEDWLFFIHGESPSERVAVSERIRNDARIWLRAMDR